MAVFQMRAFVGSVIIVALTACVGGGDGTRMTGQTETEQVAAAALAVGDAEEAARLYEVAAARTPGSVEAFLGLGRSYAALGQFNRAQSALEAAKDLKPRRAEVHAEMGRLDLMQGEAEAALAHYDEALKFAPKDLAGLTGKAVTLDYLSRHDEAQVVYAIGLKHYPTNFPLLSNKALSLVLAGDSAAGIPLLEELLRDSTHGETVRANLAIAYALDGRLSDARAMLKGVLGAEETNAALAIYAKAKREREAGQPIGYLLFR